MQIRITKRADLDLDQIWVYVAIESGSFDIADRLITNIHSRMSILKQFPMSGKSRDEELGLEVRSLVCGKYLVFYRVKDEIIWIIRVRHGSREIKEELFEN